MTKLTNLNRNVGAAPSQTQSGDIEAFSFGEPTPVLDSRDISGLMEVYKNNGYYEPPVSLSGLAKSLGASVYHASAIHWKLNRLCAHFIPHPLLSALEFRKFAKDDLVFANAYMERVDNRLNGKPIRLAVSPAIRTRKSVEFDKYVFLESWSKKHEFDEGKVFHLLEPDVMQEHYGIPQYVAGLNAAWLDEAATLFRRKYYKNGSHAGYILYLTDSAHKEEDINALKKALKDSKGPGNFRNLFMYAPNGKKDGLQVMPLAEATAKDEFFNIKRASMRDMLTAHRVPPQALGIIPETNGGFGDAKVADELAYRNEIVSIQMRMMAVNDWVGEKVISFKPYEELSA